MSSSESIQSQHGDKNKEDYAGHVGTRMISEVKSKGGNSVPYSWALDDANFIPIQGQQQDGSYNNVRSPPRFGRANRRQGTPSSKASEGEFSLPPEMGENETKDSRKDSSFKSWLTSGLLDALNTAAGVTLSTTGQLIAPPLHVTKTILLPGLLALFIDTLDANAPQRLKDWFRILSSSVYHLFSVLRSTSSGQKFSSQFVVVVQDALAALSSPETRQVLVDGMACSVKLADALNTAEVHDWMDHAVLLGCRLVDAASSGKTKQLLHDTKDLVWNGIEMATDPATTLATAEVMAHLCYALEDVQQSLEPNNRSRRNTQNRATYLDNLQMSDLSKQHVSMEKIILSCLGKLEDDDFNSFPDINVPSNVVLDEERSATDIRSNNWKDRRDSVNVELLKEKIFTKPSIREQPDGKSSASSMAPTLDSLPIIASGDLENEEDVNIVPTQETRNDLSAEDMEDIACDKAPDESKSRTRRPQNSTSAPNLQDQAPKEPAVRQFYRMLDDLLEKNRAANTTASRRTATEVMNEQNTENLESDQWSLLRAKVKKIKEDTTKRKLERENTIRKDKKSRFQRFPIQHKILILMFAFILLIFFLLWAGFGIYGLYTFVKVQFQWENTPTFTKQPTEVPQVTSNSAPPSKGNSEVIIRVIREVIHVREDGSVIEGSSLPDESAFSASQLDAVAECLSSEFSRQTRGSKSGRQRPEEDVRTETEPVTETDEQAQLYDFKEEAEPRIESDEPAQVDNLKEKAETRIESDEPAHVGNLKEEASRNKDWK